jgi:hypothetical protein
MHTVLGGLGISLELDFLDMESQNDGPDQAERKSRIAVNDVVCANVLQLDLVRVQKGQGLGHVFQLVYTQLRALAWARKLYGRETFE